MATKFKLDFIRKLRNKFYKWNFLKVYTTPFKRPKITCYMGKVAIGTPYFFPRVRCKNGGQRRKRIGFDIIALGWKCKYEDIRHEWDPGISFVFFNFQIAIAFKAPNYKDCEASYWEAFLWYNLRTNKSLSKKDRLIETFSKYSCTWSRGSGENIAYMNHYFGFVPKNTIN